MGPLLLRGKLRPPTNSNCTVFTGPYDSDFVFRKHITTADTVWSPCATDGDLNVYTQLQVKNSEPTVDIDQQAAMSAASRGRAHDHHQV